MDWYRFLIIASNHLRLDPCTALQVVLVGVDDV